MSNSDLYCNYQKCHKVITNFAWITSCSHVFCEEDGKRTFEHEKKCPSCCLELSKRYDIVRVNLNPPEEFKSMVLAGLRPEIILEIAARSICFWSYQMAYENMHQTVANKHWRERFVELESTHQTLLVKMKNDHEVKNKKYEAKQIELEIQTKRVKELEERLYEKLRLIQTFQVTKKKETSKYESLRRTVLSTGGSNKELNLHDMMLPSVSSQVTNQDSLIFSHTRTKPSSVDDHNTLDKEFQFMPFTSNSPSRNMLWH